MSRVNSRTNKKRRARLLILGVMVLVMVGGVYAKINIFNNEIATGGEIIEETRTNATKETEEAYSGEDTPIIPDDVNPQSIKNYELVTENEMYKIRKLDNVYTVTLYAIINRPDQADSYRDQLSEYKGYALQYLREQGLKPDKLKINYEPEEATNL